VPACPAGISLTHVPVCPTKQLLLQIFSITQLYRFNHIFAVTFSDFEDLMSSGCTFINMWLRRFGCLCTLTQLTNL
jgi:hypothetical protein